jgi:hypothetical protein
MIWSAGVLFLGLLWGGVAAHASPVVELIGADPFLFPQSPSPSVIFSPLGVPPFNADPSNSGFIFTPIIPGEQMGAGQLSLSEPFAVQNFSIHNLNPVNIGGSFFDVFVTLDPGPNSGGLNLSRASDSASSGTFNSFFDVFVELDLTPIGGGAPMIIQQQEVFQFNGTWSSNPVGGTGTIMLDGPFQAMAPDGSVLNFTNAPAPMAPMPGTAWGGLGLLAAFGAARMLMVMRGRSACRGSEAA